MAAIPKELPVGLEPYGRSPDFTDENLPARLRSAHSTKAGVWALIHVLEGKILYKLEAPFQGERLASIGENVVVEPEVLHHVEFIDQGRIYIEFYRAIQRLP